MSGVVDADVNIYQKLYDFIQREVKFKCVFKAVCLFIEHIGGTNSVRTISLYIYILYIRLV